MSPEDIRVILEACEKTGVAELEYGDFWVTFGRTNREVKEQEQILGLQPEKVLFTPPPATEIAGIQEKIAKEALTAAELALKEDQIADLLIEDPAELERMVRDGEITDDQLFGSVEEA